MHVSAVLLCLGLVVLVLAARPGAVSAGSKDGGYQTAFTKWTSSGLVGFAGVGVKFDQTRLVLDLRRAVSEFDSGGIHNGGSYKVGEAIGPLVPISFPFTEAVPSWNATTPDGTWVEVLLRAKIDERWTKWYNMGVWASGTGTIERHSVKLQGDSDGYVATDTLVLNTKKVPAAALQMKVRLFSTNSSVPSIRGLSLAYSSLSPDKPTLSAGNATNWNTLLAVPQCSQMVYPDGGNVWCSPTSTSMVLGFWGSDPGPCEYRVRNAVNGVYDYVYDGHGNWPFNTAYAASRGMEAYVVRYKGLDQVESWLKSGVPVVVSYAWKKGELTGAPIEASSGHLGVIVGFDAQGNPIVNDPAARSDGEVQRTYLRSKFESLWLQNSGGTVYVIFPPGHATGF